MVTRFLRIFVGCNIPKVAPAILKFCADIYPMFKSEVQIRVRYAETDKMGYVYYGNYATYFEVARVEALRQLGFSYRQMEEDGVMLPVHKFNIEYLRPAYYDDLLNIVTTIAELPGARIVFNYETFNESDEMVNRGTTTLVFVNTENGKPCQAPAEFLDRINEYFTK